MVWGAAVHLRLSWGLGTASGGLGDRLSHAPALYRKIVSTRRSAIGAIGNQVSCQSSLSHIPEHTTSRQHVRSISSRIAPEQSLLRTLASPQVSVQKKSDNVRSSIRLRHGNKVLDPHSSEGGRSRNPRRCTTGSVERERATLG